MNIERLYTIGDSWTQGYSLRNPKTECYPYLISKKLKCDLENHAFYRSNDWMFRKTIQWICSQKKIYQMYSYLLDGVYQVEEKKMESFTMEGLWNANHKSVD